MGTSDVLVLSAGVGETMFMRPICQAHSLDRKVALIVLGQIINGAGGTYVLMTVGDT